MEKLMKPAEYAKELGISRQAVYAKIKKGILTAKEVEGKLYIVVDNIVTPKASVKTSAPSRPKSTSTAPSSTPARDKAVHEEYQKLLAAKDETISVLKGTVEDLKESNKQISSTLKSEIDLLKSAFSEMRSLYVHRIEQMKSENPETQKEDILEADVREEERPQTQQEWVSVKRFLKYHDISKEKQKTKIVKKLKKAYKSGDIRVNRIDGKLKVDIASNYEDIIG